MKKSNILIAVLAVVMAASTAKAEDTIMDFDGKTAGTVSFDYLPGNSGSGQNDKIISAVPVLEKTDEDSFKLPETCDEEVKKDLFRSVYFIDARPMFSYEYLSRLQKCSNEEQVGYLLEYLGGKTAAPTMNAPAQKSPATRECTTSNGCRYCKECGYVCLKKEDDVCVKWSDKEVCWWELQYCTAK